MTEVGDYGFRWVRAHVGTEFGVVFDRTSFEIHAEVCDWLRDLMYSGASPNTVRAYALRVAGFLNWLPSQGLAWRSVRPSTLTQWKNHLFVTPVPRGKQRRASPRRKDTVAAWLVAVIEFYRWAASEGLVSAELLSQITEEQLVRPGDRGGEQGRVRSVAGKGLRVRRTEVEKAPDWISVKSQRDALLALELRPRDRFLVALLFYCGLRIGEALSMFREDLHFLADNRPHGCRKRGPHLHVVDNESENRARPKSLRDVPIPALLALMYQEYLDERLALTPYDRSPNVFVALDGATAGQALTYATVVDLFIRMSRTLGFYVRPHLLRHTRATIWVRGLEGDPVDIDVVRVLLGHRSLSSTLIYTHASEEAKRAAVTNAAIETQEVTE